MERKWPNSAHAVTPITLQSVTHLASDYKQRIHSMDSPCHLAFNAKIKLICHGMLNSIQKEAVAGCLCNKKMTLNLVCIEFVNTYV